MLASPFAYIKNDIINQNSDVAELGETMVIVNDIRENETYYYLPISEEELNESIQHGTFIDIIKSVKLLDTHVMPFDEAKEIIDRLPEKHLIFKTQLNKDSLVFVTRKGKCFCRIYWHCFCNQSFCTVVLEKAKQKSNKLNFYVCGMVAGKKGEELRQACEKFIFKLMNSGKQDSKAELLPIFSINAVYNEEFEFMVPRCDIEEYELFKKMLLAAISDVFSKEIFDSFSQYL